MSEKTVVVKGVAEISWSVELPIEHQWDGKCCKDPAIEAAICSLPQDCDVFLFGKNGPPANVYVEVDERDFTVEEDERDPPKSSQ